MNKGELSRKGKAVGLSQGEEAAGLWYQQIPLWLLPQTKLEPPDVSLY